MDVLKIATAGNVDDGKSTLIGRLLFETKSLKSDQLEYIRYKSQFLGYDYLDFSLATDGLLTEREQGITIDVSHIYFSSLNRRFIIADSPGHEEYTRNMVTGTSTSELAIILLDARKGVMKQTKRHFYITQLLGIQNVLVAINKMDLVNYSNKIYNKIVSSFMYVFHSFLNHNLNLIFIPISALKGDNIVNLSNNMLWYEGQTLLQLLENINLKDPLFTEQVMQVQYIIRPRISKFYDYRGFAGKMRSGNFKIGEKIKIFPSGTISKISLIEKYGKSIEILKQNENGTIILEDEVNVSRGDIFIGIDSEIIVSKIIIATLCWMQTEFLCTDKKVIVQHGIYRVLGKIQKVYNKINLDTLDVLDTDKLCLNDIGRVKIELSNPMLMCSYKKNFYLGAFIIIDNITNNTAGVGFVN